ncbi:hypothetical protein JQ574_22740 [Bradyrhizobium sp. AUGA SZCCT0158]|uniref:hypothetical protein n=1 Tax=Bradyrhizobium sp. AUGA SZCCT0158 TaxID=2807661 RepID=UPI001BAA1CB7|nr:hypothetical protein [Bradyrhizobium sp. AUGA SZCCT0158]MBR1198818.1 hypothetical protein [Bradyrhizobium sp. AUGA SZCCT0158]
MANAALVIDNQADGATVGASSQVLVMPASNLLTPHPSERWRSLNSAAYFVLDKGAVISADTVGVFGLTCGTNATIRLRLNSIDVTGAAGDILDTGTLSSGDPSFDVEYGSLVHRPPAPDAWRYCRVDIDDPDADFVEAGCIVDGLSESFAYNFAPGSSVQHIDRSRVAPTSSGMTLIWDDNYFRRVDLNFQWVNEAQRYGLVERMDRVCGRRRNVLLMTDTESTNLPRASIYGLVTDITPVTFGAIFDLFGKQLRIDERI